jgi:hypothetical protein
VAIVLGLRLHSDRRSGGCRGRTTPPREVGQAGPARMARSGGEVRLVVSVTEAAELLGISRGLAYRRGAR